MKINRALRYWCLALSLNLCSALCVQAFAEAPPTFNAANRVEISPLLTTSGQPSEKMLQSLRLFGYEAVIFLVPSGIEGNVENEAAILKQQGIEFVHIPIKFDEPTEAHYTAFAAAMARLAKKKVLVHCEVNLRASSMVFLYRTIALKAEPSNTYESVSRVWVPRYAWKPYIEKMLAANKISFALH
jgi:protein tyrosine phosphatase (PTP) superfamily phosphohydrolase (DUF442 family)